MFGAKLFEDEYLAIDELARSDWSVDWGTRRTYHFVPQTALFHIIWMFRQHYSGLFYTDNSLDDLLELTLVIKSHLMITTQNLI